jgi:hypothetical protein
MNRRIGLIAAAVVLVIAVSACGEPEPQTVEVTREVGVPQTVEVTREVTKIVEKVVKETVEVEVVVTATPRPTRRPTATPERTMEDWQSEMAEAIISDLEGFSDVERVNLVRWDEGLLEIEVQTQWASRDNQPEVSWTIIATFAEPLADMSEGQRMALTGSEDLTVKLTTYSTDGDYRYRSETDFSTLVKLKNRSMSYDEWVQAANAGFR